MKKLFFVFLFLNISYKLFSITAEIKPRYDFMQYVDGELKGYVGGSGYFGDPYVFNRRDVELIIKVYPGAGEDGDDYLYWPQIHMDGYRNCSTMWGTSGGRSYGDVNNYTFTFTADMTGNFYLRCDILHPGNKLYTETWWNWIHIRIETPPIIDYTDPYTPPQGNDPPVVIITPTNVQSISGDTWYLHKDSTYFRFTLRDTYDKDGTNKADATNELYQGVFLWGCQTHDASVTGTAHIYPTQLAGLPGQLDEIQTYLFYDDIDSVFSVPVSGYDLEKNPWDIFAEVWDKWGVEPTVALGKKLKWTTDYTPPPPDEIPIISIYPDTVDFDTSNVQQQFTIFNTGNGTLAWTSVASIPWYTASAYSGYIPAKSSKTVYCYCERDSFVAAGSDTQKITFTGGNGDSLFVIATLLETPPSDPSLSVSQDTINFRNNLTAGNFTINNIGLGDCDWTITESLSWLTPDTTQGTIKQGQSENVVLYVSRSGIADGEYEGYVTATVGAVSDSALAVMWYIDPPDPPQYLRVVE